MRVMLLSFSETGEVLGEKLKRKFDQSGEHEVVNIPYKGRKETARTYVKQAFLSYDGIVFIGAVGIAIRLIAPYVADKKSDPFVVGMDETGEFAISLLSGHLGGGNEATEQIARWMNATPVITTATDLHEAFAVDLFAKRNLLHITSMKRAKEISAAVLQGEPIGFASEIAVGDTLPEELTERRREDGYHIFIQRAGYGEIRSDEKTLVLTEKTAVLGMGCRKGVSFAALEVTAMEALDRAGLKKEDLIAIASIDLKKDEEGLCELAKTWKLPFITYDAKRLQAVVPPEQGFSASGFVSEVTGVDNVCERAALCHAEELLMRYPYWKERAVPELSVEKFSVNGTTAAIAKLPKRAEIRFS